MNIRALKLAENIKTQIQDLVKQINLQACLEFYDENNLFQRYKKHETILKTTRLSERSLKQIPEYQNDVLDLFDRFRLALTTGYINLTKILLLFFKSK